MSQLILRELGRFDQQLVSQVVSIIQDERQVQDEEATMLVELLRRDLDRWDARPAMSDYCGLHEKDGIFLLHEVMNRDANCGKYNSDTRPSRACNSCRQRTLGDGPESDRQIMDELKTLALQAVPAGMSPNTQDMSNHLQLVGANKSFEAAQAYYIGHFLFERPRYLSSCAFASTTEEYIPCVVRNPDDVCADWNGGEEQTSLEDEERLGAPSMAERSDTRKLLERLKSL